MESGGAGSRKVGFAPFARLRPSPAAREVDVDRRYYRPSARLETAGETLFRGALLSVLERAEGAARSDRPDWTGPSGSGRGCLYSQRSRVWPAVSVRQRLVADGSQQQRRPKAEDNPYC